MVTHDFQVGIWYTGTNYAFGYFLFRDDIEGKVRIGVPNYFVSGIKTPQIVATEIQSCSPIPRKDQIINVDPNGKEFHIPFGVEEGKRALSEDEMKEVLDALNGK